MGRRNAAGRQPLRHFKDQGGDQVPGADRERHHMPGDIATVQRELPNHPTADRQRLPEEALQGRTKGKYLGLFISMLGSYDK